MNIELKRCFLALDNKSKPEVFELLAKLKAQNLKLPLKIGLELFCAHGPAVVQDIFDFYPTDIFLDLKLHDIPNTVAKAVRSLQVLPVRWITVHLAGGHDMLQAAQEELKQSNPNAKLLGVSYLTSLDTSDFQELWGINGQTAQAEAFARLFELAIKVDLGGIVCSPHEIQLFQTVWKKHESKFKQLGFTKPICVCPGIRFSEEIEAQTTQDQKRVLTPAEAFSAGADYLVLGRSLTGVDQDRLVQRVRKLLELEESSI